MVRPMAAGARVAVVIVAVAFVAAACGGASSQGTGTSPRPESGSTSPTSPAGEERWLAAVQVAPRADDLDRATERLRDVLGPALVVSPVDCFEGLPPEAGDDGYVIGALAGSEAEAKAMIEDAGEGALFTVNVTIVCPD